MIETLGLLRAILSISSNVDDAIFGERYIEVRRLYEPEQNVLYVFADVPCLGEGGRVGDGEWDFEDVGECLGEVGPCLNRRVRA